MHICIYTDVGLPAKDRDGPTPSPRCRESCRLDR